MVDKTQWNERIKLIEKALVEELHEDSALDPKLCESMKYSLTAGGKRLRPILLMAASLDSSSVISDDNIPKSDFATSTRS